MRVVTNQDPASQNSQILHGKLTKLIVVQKMLAQMSYRRPWSLMGFVTRHRSIQIMVAFHATECELRLGPLRLACVLLAVASGGCIQHSCRWCRGTRTPLLIHQTST